MPDARGAVRPGRRREDRGMRCRVCLGHSEVTDSRQTQTGMRRRRRCAVCGRRWTTKEVEVRS